MKKNATKIPPENLSDDELTAKHTAFKTMQDLLEAKGGYRPSLRALTAKTLNERLELGRLADAYDAHQHACGDIRRAHRS